MSIRTRMMVLIALPTLVIYVVVLGLLLAHLRVVNRAEVERHMLERASNYAARFDGAFREVSSVARTTAHVVEEMGGLDDAGALAVLRANVEENPLVYGSAMAFEPREGEGEGEGGLRCPYVYRGGDGLVEMNISRDVYDWYGDARWTWWHVPRGTGEAAWSEAYFDEGAGNEVMVTFSAPFERGGEFGGVVTVDVMVSAIREHVGRSIAGGASFVILEGDGRIVSSAGEGGSLDETVFERASAVGREDIAAAARAIVSGGRGVTMLPGFEGTPPEGWEGWGETRWVFHAPIGSTGWGFAVLVSEREALAEVRRRMVLAVAVLAGTLVLIVLGIWVVSGRLARPVRELTGAVGRIAGGDLDHRVRVGGADELARLGAGVNSMAADLKGYTERIARTRSQSREAMIFALAKLAESLDDDTGKHLERICRYVELLGAEIARRDPEIDEGWVRTVAVTAALHDIGKVGIPDGVLKKPGRLTDEERSVMNSHTTIGGDTLLAVRRQWTEDEFLRLAAEIALAHHEKWDGSGYPFGLSGETIGLAARIVAVADVYDALTSERVYKKAMGHEEARAIIVEGSGSHFDPGVVEAFLAVEDGFRGIAEELR